jgi:hypothetical protein
MLCEVGKEGRRKREEGRRKREEGRGKREEGMGVNLTSNVVLIYCLTMIVQIP